MLSDEPKNYLRLLKFQKISLGTRPQIPMLNAIGSRLHHCLPYNLKSHSYPPLAPFSVCSSAHVHHVIQNTRTYHTVLLLLTAPKESATASLVTLHRRTRQQILIEDQLQPPLDMVTDQECELHKPNSWTKARVIRHDTNCQQEQVVCAAGLLH